MGSIRKITRQENARMTHRLLSAMPTTTFEMQTLCHLAGIEVSRNLPTAAVECIHRPRLLINPDFVEQYCKRDEHLFLLVMHELWHVQLAHTRMYPRMTRLQNIALDAIINSGLMREFPQPEYRGFFEAVNPADKFPACLLRPPEGWPYNPKYPEVGPPGTTEMAKRLYPPGNLSFYSPPLYEEVLALLLKGGMKWVEEGQYMLLGNHDGSPVHDPLMKEFIQEVTSNWKNLPFERRGNGSRISKRKYRITPGSEAMRREFARVLQISLGKRRGYEKRKAKVKVSAVTGTGVLPNPRDRMSHARRQLGAPQTLWAQPGDVNARLPERPSRAFVYLDVSGSMFDCLHYLLGLLLPYVANKKAEVFQFSTIVKPLSFEDLRQGNMTTTGGTNINPVLEHLVSVEPIVDRVLILTDGAVGAPDPLLKEKVQALDPKIIVVLPFNGRLNYAMNDISTSVVRLPALQ